MDGVGLGTIADSFAAIEQRVVREQKLPWEELYQATRGNFADKERTRLMLQSSERYCAGNALGDRWARQIRTISPKRFALRRCRKTTNWCRAGLPGARPFTSARKSALPRMAAKPMDRQRTARFHDCALNERNVHLSNQFGVSLNGVSYAHHSLAILSN